MQTHPIAQLVRTHLTGSSVTHVPMVFPADFQEAVARYGAGVDHVAGETPLALIKAKMDSRATGRGYTASYVVTDRRLFGRVQGSNTPRLFTEVPYAHVVAPPTRPGALAQSLTVRVGNEERKLYVVPRALQAFLAAMVATLPPAARSYGPPPADPLAAWNALPTGINPDPRASVPLRVLFEAQRGGLSDGRDMPRMVELARTVTFGRGGNALGWRSVLPGPVLLDALRAVLGQPSSVQPTPNGAVADFPIGAGSGAGKAVASSVVGLALFATVGVGWVTTAHGQKLQTIRAHINEAGPDAATFYLAGTSGVQWESLSLHWWRAVDGIHQALSRMEARYLLGRAVKVPPEHLLTIPREALEQPVSALVGPTDLAKFYPS